MRSDSPDLSTLRMVRWRRGLAEHRTNGETEYVGAPPQVEALEELADTINYLMLMQQKWSGVKLESRAAEVDAMVIDIKAMYDTIARWAEVDGVDMGSLWPDEASDQGAGQTEHEDAED